MFCSRCGANNPDIADFCTRRGAPMPKAVSTTVSGSSAAPESAPEKGKNTKTIVIAAILAVLIIAAILVAAILIKNASGGDGSGGGSSDRGSSIAQTPEEVVENYLKAEFEGDLVWSAKCRGYDYDAYKVDDLKDEYTDLDDAIENKVEYFEDEDADEDLGDIGIDASEWADKFADVETEEEYIEVQKQYQKEYYEHYNREYDRSYQIEEIEAEELSGEELREAEDSFEKWYIANEDWRYGRMIFEEDQVEAFYEVNVKIKYEPDGDSETETRTYVVAETEEGCFIVSLY